MSVEFDIQFLDHVAITVSDMEASVRWYERILGLKRYDVPEWGDAPIFMLAGKTGLALFPARDTVDEDDPGKAMPPIRIDHYAFNVDRNNFEKARRHYDELGLDYQIKDHIHFHSMYARDPDGHTVELTTLITDEQEFY